MIKEKWEEIKRIECRECGRYFDTYDGLAIHILNSWDHVHKKWAKQYYRKHTMK